MKKIFLLFIGAGFMLTSCVGNPDGEKAATGDAVEVSESYGGKYYLDLEGSYVEWTGRKVSATHHGTIGIQQGTVDIAAGKITGGKVVIDMTNIENLDLEGEWNEKLVGHLHSPDFFDTENFKEATFVFAEATKTGEGNEYTVTGNLTIKDITKSITFKANIDITNENFVMKADFNIEREDWGITYAGMADDLIAKEINFKINIKAENNI